MQTERGLRRYQDADLWPTEEALAAMLENQATAFAAVRQALPALTQAVGQTVARLGGTGRLFYAGAGAAGRIAAQDGVELHPTFGWPHDRLGYLIAGGAGALQQAAEGAEDDEDAARAELAALHPHAADVVVSVTASGSTRYTNAVQDAAREAGALTIGVANNPGSRLLQGAEIPVLLDTGPEFLAGSTRLLAATAQKIALNMVSTQVMTELGRVYRGLMVNVVASNAKLVARARAMVAALSGMDETAAARAYAEAGGDVRLAVLLADGLAPETARRRLAEAGGNLRRARGEAPRGETP